MRIRRILLGLVAIPLIMAPLTGCGGKAKEEAQKLAQLGDQLSQIKADWAGLRQQREDLAAARSALAEAEAVPARKRDDASKAQLQELPAKITELEQSTSAGYDALQEKLAAFLTTGLNEYPDAPATSEGLKIYADEGIFNAEDIIRKSGDYKKAIETLQTAKSYFETVGLEPYGPLKDAMTRYDDLRYITRERFDQIKKGMTEDEVSAIAGVPYYMNKKRDEKRGVEYWLYPRREGGAAAVYFNKRRTAYSKKFDAVKPKIATD